MKKLAVLSLLAAASMTFTPSEAEAGKCSSKKEVSTNKEICKVIPMTVDLSESPYIMQNPNAADCHLGNLQMPGLPDFGIDLNSLGDFSLCNVLQSVTEDMVAQVNDLTQSIVDEGVNSIRDSTVVGDGLDMVDGYNDAVKTANTIGSSSGGVESINSQELLKLLKTTEPSKTQ